MPKLTLRMGERQQYHIRKRIIIHGNLVLLTPTHLGNGDTDAPTDMALMRDSISDAALLTGSGIAGALRNYLRAREQGDGKCEPSETKGMAEKLFGGLKGADEGSQSPLIVSDARSLTDDPRIELRDGVRINAQTRTADDTGKYDLELLAAGTTFPLRFELRIADNDDEQVLRDSLAISLSGLESNQTTNLQSGEIGIGMKKRRGFGRCRVAGWRVWEFDLTDPDDLLCWLEFKYDFDTQFSPSSPSPQTAVQALGASSAVSLDNRQRAVLEAAFTLAGPLLIRSGQDEAVLGPDVRHLHAMQVEGQLQPVVSGTSLAGVLRHRAERIANTIRPGSGSAFVDHLFGRMPNAQQADDMGQASRMVVHEHVVHNVNTDLVQNRIAIDRFTGGAYEGALFNAQPVFATPETHLTLMIEIVDPDTAEIGMLLLLLKDLWTADLPIGGESSIGRGRLRGRWARLRCTGRTELNITEASGVLQVKETVTDEAGNPQIQDADQAALERLITDLHQALATGIPNGTKESVRNH